MITREEAIKYFEDWAQCNYKPTREATKMAVSALRAQKDYEELKIQWDMYGGEEGITDAYRAKEMLEKDQQEADSIVTEFCPHCGTEIEMRWSVEQFGYKAFCPVCGKRLMLCDECRHPKGEYVDNCDYDQYTDSCKHNQQEAEENEPLTLGEIDNLDEFPIFFVPKEQDSDALPGWCIYRCKTATACSATRKSCLYFFYRKDYGKKWLAYRRPPIKKEDKK